MLFLFGHPMFYKRRRSTYRQKKGFPIIRFMFFILIIFLSFILLESRVEPVLKDMAVYRVKNIALKAINDSISSQMQNRNIKYDSLVTLDKDSSGKITALRTNMNEINIIKASIMEDVIEKLSTVDTSSISIPVGNLFGWDLMSGWGPRIPIRILPLNFINANFVNVFTSAGINQTRLQIMLDVSSDVGVVLPGVSTSTNVTTRVTVAETLIVGSIPQSYTYIEEASRSQLERYNDYHKDQQITN